MSAVKLALFAMTPQSGPAPNVAPYGDNIFFWGGCSRPPLFALTALVVATAIVKQPLGEIDFGIYYTGPNTI